MNWDDLKMRMYSQRDQSRRDKQIGRLSSSNAEEKGRGRVETEENPPTAVELRGEGYGGGTDDDTDDDTVGRMAEKQRLSWELLARHSRHTQTQRAIPHVPQAGPVGDTSDAAIAVETTRTWASEEDTGKKGGGDSLLCKLRARMGWDTNPDGGKLSTRQSTSSIHSLRTAPPALVSSLIEAKNDGPRAKDDNRDTNGRRPPSHGVKWTSNFDSTDVGREWKESSSAKTEPKRSILEKNPLFTPPELESPGPEHPRHLKKGKSPRRRRLLSLSIQPLKRILGVRQRRSKASTTQDPTAANGGRPLTATILLDSEHVNDPDPRSTFWHAGGGRGMDGAESGTLALVSSTVSLSSSSPSCRPLSNLSRIPPPPSVSMGDGSVVLEGIPDMPLSTALGNIRGESVGRSFKSTAFSTQSRITNASAFSTAEGENEDNWCGPIDDEAAGPLRSITCIDKRDEDNENDTPPRPCLFEAYDGSDGSVCDGVDAVSDGIVDDRIDYSGEDSGIFLLVEISKAESTRAASVGQKSVVSSASTVVQSNVTTPTEGSNSMLRLPPLSGSSPVVSPLQIPHPRSESEEVTTGSAFAASLRSEDSSTQFSGEAYGGPAMTLTTVETHLPGKVPDITTTAIPTTPTRALLFPSLRSASLNDMMVKYNAASAPIVLGPLHEAANNPRPSSIRVSDGIVLSSRQSVNEGDGVGDVDFETHGHIILEGPVPSNLQREQEGDEGLEISANKLQTNPVDPLWWSVCIPLTPNEDKASSNHHCSHLSVESLDDVRAVHNTLFQLLKVRLRKQRTVSQIFISLVELRS